MAIQRIDSYVLGDLMKSGEQGYTIELQNRVGSIWRTDMLKDYVWEEGSPAYDLLVRIVVHGYDCVRSNWVYYDSDVRWRVRVG